MLKLIHGADFHLDSPFSGLTPEQAARRREEQRDLLDRLDRLAREREADLVLLSGDLLESGLHLSGGGALLTGLRQRLEHEVGVPVHVSEHPQRDVVLGLGAAVSDERLMAMLANGGALDLTGE